MHITYLSELNLCISHVHDIVAIQCTSVCTPSSNDGQIIIVTLLQPSTCLLNFKGVK